MNDLRRRCPRPVAPSTWRNLPDSDTGRPRSAPGAAATAAAPNSRSVDGNLGDCAHHDL